MGEYLEFEYSINQLKLYQVDYKIDYETDTLKINYRGLEDNTIKMYDMIRHEFIKKYPNYSNLWSNKCLNLCL